jgi:sugar phosphate isomerase/epimerase
MMSTHDIQLGVSLYSYGADFLITMSLEDCLADIADMGATGVEILADTHIPGYPHPEAAWVDHWHELLRKYGLTPTCLSTWIDTRLHRGRPLTVDEGLAIFVRDLELAHRLGFTLIRPKLGVVSLDLLPDPVWREIMRRALPHARQHNIRIVPEIHAPTPLRSQIVDDYLGFAAEEGTKHFGLLIDTGIFQSQVRTGGHSDSKQIFGAPDPALAAQVGRAMMTPLRDDPAELVPIMPRVFHIHAKFWEMTDELDDPHIPWAPVIKALVEGGYEGYLSSEYEGPRELFRAANVLRRQHVMLRRLLAAHGVRVPTP